MRYGLCWWKDYRSEGILQGLNGSLFPGRLQEIDELMWTSLLSHFRVSRSFSLHLLSNTKEIDTPDQTLPGPHQKSDLTNRLTRAFPPPSADLQHPGFQRITID
jgi:hypothetical protein